jgi:3-oxoacyl-[acyl-carrier protein] reductase
MAGDAGNDGPRIALVTGASRGLGRSIASELAAEGFDLALAARSAEGLASLASEVEAAGRSCLAVPCDVTQAGEIRALFAAAVERFGRLDVVVSNAGGSTAGGKQLWDVSDEDWHYDIDLNLSSAFFCAREAARVMKDQPGGGVIVNLASGYGFRGGRNNFMYTASKAGIVNLTRSLALSLADFGIRCVAVAPGFFPQYEASQEMGRKAARNIPLRRTGENRELTRLVAFLVSPASWPITGSTIAIDGGGLAAGCLPTGWPSEVSQ